MKDRLKIRLWDITKQKFVEVTGIEYYTDGYEIDVHYDDDFFETALDEKYLKACFVEQCTGCRDCSNQLIYEGDILEIAEDMGTSHVIVRWDNEFQKWGVEGDTEADYEFYDLVRRPCDTDGAIDDIGIVGNIHENPELLEEDK